MGLPPQRGPAHMRMHTHAPHRCRCMSGAPVCKGTLALAPPTLPAALLLCRGDPNAAEQETFCPSSAGWPPFMRVNPILEWSYHDVWGFLQASAVWWVFVWSSVWVGAWGLKGEGRACPSASWVRDAALMPHWVGRECKQRSQHAKHMRRRARASPVMAAPHPLGSRDSGSCLAPTPLAAGRRALLLPVRPRLHLAGFR